MATIDRAFILAAGLGKRMRPYTDTIPKPMVPVNGRPILDYTLDKLEKAGIGDVVINLNYLGDRIENHLAGRTSPRIEFSWERELLDTGGGVKKAIRTFGDKPFFIINGDAFWTEGKEQGALERLAAYWNPDKMDILLLLQPVKEMILTQGVGDYDLNKEGIATRSQTQTGQYMFAGVRISKPEIFENTPDGAFSFLSLMDRAQEQGRLHAVIHDGQWHHISTPADLDRVNQTLAADGSKAEQAASA